MNHHSLDTRLKNDTHLLGHFKKSTLLLINNALFPWFILVPHTLETEFHRLDETMQHCIVYETKLISEFIETHYHINKINIATIGNIVSQMHIHIVGRHKNDICWPKVVWGIEDKKPYCDHDINQLKQMLKDISWHNFSVYNGSSSHPPD